MAEIKIFYKDNEKIRVAKAISALKDFDKSDILWIDLLDVSDITEDALEDFLKIDIQEDDEMEEIEMSSRYIQTDDSIVINSNFLKTDFENVPVNFIMKNNTLVSVHDTKLDTFTETAKSVTLNSGNYQTGFHVLVSLLETRVWKDADMIEDLTDMITDISNKITEGSKEIDDSLLIQIKDLQEKVTIIRQNSMDKQRVISNLLKCNFLPKDLQTRLTMIIKDINSLLDYVKFDFDRLDYLQDTFLGLVNIEQNKIIKIFTVVNIIFLPPTLIASAYGMNFKFMPSLEWHYGNLFAIALMLLSVFITLGIFKIKKWL